MDVAIPPEQSDGINLFAKEEGVKVRVYFDSRKKTYSIVGRDKSTGRDRVILKSKSFTLKNARFVVSPSGVQRIRRTGTKSVVATVEGELWSPGTPSGEKVRFNPYEMMTFQSMDGSPIHCAAIAHFTPQGVYVE